MLSIPRKETFGVHTHRAARRDCHHRVLNCIAVASSPARREAAAGLNQKITSNNLGWPSITTNQSTAACLRVRCLFVNQTTSPLHQLFWPADPHSSLHRTREYLQFRSISTLRMAICLTKTRSPRYRIVSLSERNQFTSGFGCLVRLIGGNNYAYCMGTGMCVGGTSGTVTTRPRSASTSVDTGAKSTDGLTNTLFMSRSKTGTLHSRLRIAGEYQRSE